MDITFWPHIWAIPLLLMIGLATGWYLRSLLDSDVFDDRKPLPRKDIAPHSPPPEKSEEHDSDPKVPR